MVALFWNYSENMATRKESLQRWRIWHSSKGLGGIVSWFCHCSQLTVPASYSLECLRGARGTSTERDVAREGPSSAPLEHPPPIRMTCPSFAGVACSLLGHYSTLSITQSGSSPLDTRTAAFKGATQDGPAFS